MHSFRLIFCLRPALVLFSVCVGLFALGSLSDVALAGQVVREVLPETTLSVPNGSKTRIKTKNKVFSHDAWADVLSRYVSPKGAISVAPLKASPKMLNAYMDALATVSPDTNPARFPTPSHALAYWINAYNAISLNLVLDYYPAKTLAKMPGSRFVQRYRLGGVPFSLHSLEQKIVHAYWQKPLVVFALTDHTYSAPPLRVSPYQGELLQEQLEAQFNVFMQEKPAPVLIPSACGAVTLAPMFQQFRRPLQRSFRLSPESSMAEPDTALGRFLLRTPVGFLLRYLPAQTRGALLKPCEAPREVRYQRGNDKLRLSD